jgi:hypothetical protein
LNKQFWPLDDEASGTEPSLSIIEFELLYLNEVVLLIEENVFKDFCNKPKNLISQPQQQMRQEIPWFMNAQQST